MRIAFDLDDTLIPNSEFACGSNRASFPFSICFNEKLRKGSEKLLREIAGEHELWIYTTSCRKPLYLKSWFCCLGIKLTNVINQDIHLKAVKSNSYYSQFTKAPKLFDIDLLIDDLPGVGIECQKQGCDCLIIDPYDLAWTEKIKDKIKRYPKRI